VGKREEGVVPLNVVVPVAAGGDLRLRDDADVNVVGIKEIKQCQLPVVGKNSFRVPSRYP
jgi:hypothetical protein